MSDFPVFTCSCECDMRKRDACLQRIVKHAGAILFYFGVLAMRCDVDYGLGCSYILLYHSSSACIFISIYIHICRRIRENEWSCLIPWGVTGTFLCLIN